MFRIIRTHKRSYVVDVSGSEGRDPAADFGAINEELRQYSPALAQRPQIVVANKSDIMADEELLEQLRRRVEKAGRPVVVFVVTIDPDTGERDFDGDWEMFDGDDFVADGSWDTDANYGVTFEAYAIRLKPSTDRSEPGR